MTGRWRRGITAALALALAGAAAAGDGLQVLIPGDFHGDEVTAPAGDDWLALTPAALVPARVAIAPVFDPVLDEDEGHRPWTGRRVSADAPAPVLALLRGAALAAGPLMAAVTVGGAGQLQPRTIDWRGSVHTLALEDCTEMAGCAWVLRVGERRQVIGRFRSVLDASGTPMDLPEQTGLIWAGDLDRDGQLDLVVDISDHYNAVATVRVLLSSVAAADELVGEAGAFGAVGC